MCTKWVQSVCTEKWVIIFQELKVHDFKLNFVCRIRNWFIETGSIKNYERIGRQKFWKIWKLFWILVFAKKLCEPSRWSRLEWSHFVMRFFWKIRMVAFCCPDLQLSLSVWNSSIGITIGIMWCFSCCNTGKSQNAHKAQIHHRQFLTFGPWTATRGNSLPMNVKCTNYISFDSPYCGLQIPQKFGIFEALLGARLLEK